jgi:hypothetical protein
MRTVGVGAVRMATPRTTPTRSRDPRLNMEDPIERHLASIGVPRINNRGRNAEDRARIRRQGYSPAANSRHNLERGGRARDFEPPRGWPRGRAGERAIRAHFARAGIQLHEVIDEGHHFHISW